MKEESKEIIDWIKHVLSQTVNTNKEYYKWKAMDFLNSLSEIESHLCNGGYIQDKNGTPCCNGDRVIYDENYEGRLMWDKNKHKFYISSIIYGDYDFDKIKSFVKNEEINMFKDKSIERQEELEKMRLTMHTNVGIALTDEEIKSLEKDGWIPTGTYNGHGQPWVKNVKTGETLSVCFAYTTPLNFTCNTHVNTEMQNPLSNCGYSYQIKEE